MTETVDHEARTMATEALTKLEGHEKLCTERWERAHGTMGKLMWLLIGTLLAIAATFVLPKPTLGHDIAALWIMNNPLTASCCGERDCRALEDGDSVELIENVWRLNGWPVTRVYPSLDERARPWGCFNAPEYVRPRCLFLPGTA